MADNTKFMEEWDRRPDIAADDIGGIKHLRVKMVIGDDGVSDGDVSAVNPLPVYIGDKIGAPNTVRIDNSDILGNAAVSSRYNQVEVHFDEAFDANLVTNSQTGSAPAPTQANGHALYASGTGATGTTKGVSAHSVRYRAGFEIYTIFTAAFTTPTSANSHQRIGLYDANNGFFIGYNGLQFGTTKRVGGVDTFVPISSFNRDPLDGSAASFFTRDNVPEALDTEKSNLFRIRFAWLGHAPIIFEAFCPDGHWVPFHVLKIPNSQLNPSIENPDLPITLESIKSSADATNLIIATACWASGSATDLRRINETIHDYSLAKLVKGVIAGKTTAGGSGYVDVKVNPSGALTVDATVKSFAGDSYANITTATTTVVKSGAGTLKRIVIGSLGILGSTATIYDNTSASGTIISTIDASMAFGSIEFNCNFSTGLTIVTTGSTPPDITAIYN